MDRKGRPVTIRVPRRPLYLILATVAALVFFKLVVYGTRQTYTQLRDESALIDDVNNSTLGFEHIFVINLPSRTDRRDGLALQGAVSNIDFEFFEAVHGDRIAEKAIPEGREPGHLMGGALGCWRSHMDAIQEVVERNLSSALILEDDVDWDIRIRHQLREFAMSTQALIQPLKLTPDLYADPTYPHPREDSQPNLPDMLFHDLPVTKEPTFSPYGDNWDLLWLGHCGMQIPSEHSGNIARGRVVHENDVTVAPKKNLWGFANPFTLVDRYPEHTRVVHSVQEGVCTLGYAVSQSGARKLLHEVALKPPRDAVDILLRFFCEGTNGRAPHTCLTTQPGFFHHHRPAGPARKESDIGDHGDGYRDGGQTDMVRWSVRLNVEKLMNGQEDYGEQYPD